MPFFFKTSKTFIVGITLNMKGGSINLVNIFAFGDTDIAESLETLYISLPWGPQRRGKK
jgi:hypothetical protein